MEISNLSRRLFHDLFGYHQIQNFISELRESFETLFELSSYLLLNQIHLLNLNTELLEHQILQISLQKCRHRLLLILSLQVQTRHCLS